MWKKFVQPARPQMTIWRTRISCWIPKDTNTQSEYVILIALVRQQWLQEGNPNYATHNLPVLLYYGFDPLACYNSESVLELGQSPADTSLDLSAQDNTQEYTDMLGNARIT